jgi:KDO2-lipid IV(A) lauroyltransferase
MQRLQHFLEALLLKWLFAAFRAMPVDVASWCGSVMARAIGPFFSANAVARENLKKAFPEYSATRRREIMAAMWDNLGRTAAELPHLPGSLFNRVAITGLEHLSKEGKPALFFSAHLGNWELNAPMAFQHGIPLAVIYRHANNPYVEEMVRGLRASQCSEQFAKGPRGGMGLIKALKRNMSIAMLIDQKMNDGIAVPFFGRDAMTAPAIALLALRFDLPIIPARVVRKGGAHFEGTLYPPIVYEKTGDHDKDVLAIMTAINRTLEGWIREYPEQWFWVHRRWPKF